MLQTFTNVMDRLIVYPDKMLKDLNLTGGLIYSPILLNTLVEKGAVREQAYRWVQRNAMKRWLEGEDFLENLKKDEDVANFMTILPVKEKAAECFVTFAHIDEASGTPLPHYVKLAPLEMSALKRQQLYCRLKECC